MKTITTNSRNKSNMISRFIIAMMLVLGLGTAEKALAQPACDEEGVIPAWAPAYDYAEQVHYYYLPDLLVFYDVYTSQFIYPNGGYWMACYTLPRQYAHYDLNSAYVVLLNTKAKTPWRYAKKYNAIYPCNYYFRFQDDAICGYNENSRTMVFRNNFIDESESRRDAMERTDRNQHNAYYNGKTPERGRTLSLYDEKKDNKNNKGGLNVLR